jgi:hypothetical protein
MAQRRATAQIEREKEDNGHDAERQRSSDLEQRLERLESALRLDQQNGLRETLMSEIDR